MTQILSEWGTLLHTQRGPMSVDTVHRAIANVLHEYTLYGEGVCHAFFFYCYQQQEMARLRRLWRERFPGRVVPEAALRTWVEGMY